MQKIKLNREYRILKLIQMPKHLVVIQLANQFFRATNRLVIPKRQVHKRFTSISSIDEGKITLTTYEPKEGKKQDFFVLFIPGGGFCMPPSIFHHQYAMELSLSLNCYVDVIEYRLAPKYPYPAALRDVLQAIDFLKEMHQQTKFILLGDSAGGNLAAGATHYLKDSQLSTPLAVVLIYPGLAEAKGTLARREYIHTPMFSATDLEHVLNWVEPKEVSPLNPYLVPLQLKNFQNLPPIYIETAEFDPLTEDGPLYHQAIQNAGGSSTLYQTKGTPHGYDALAKAQTTKLARSVRLAWLKKTLGI